MRLTFNITCCTFVFLQILFAGRLIRSYLTQLILTQGYTVKLFFHSISEIHFQGHFMKYEMIS